ncbi:MAG: HesA/MoeB/ThiF family protein [Desulfobacteraceae bacterium]|nr:HesA/MoeB/ThiF family protein [Desulfobacteraceae bacterium]
MSDITSEEWLRYDRQVIIPEIGQNGQKKLKQAKIFIAGSGGLGSVISYYMAAAGTGFLAIADKDCVELDNLNRQIIHRTNDIGKPKTESALEKLRQINPHCQIRTIQDEIRDDNILDMVGDCSVILDATDNLETRKALNNAHISKGIPFIYGGIDGFSGMVTTFIPRETPCLECLFPYKKTKTHKIGALGPVAGLVASIQSTEAVKLILGMDGLLKCRLLHIKAADMTFREIRTEKNPCCKVCGSDTNEHPQQ